MQSDNASPNGHHGQAEDPLQRGARPRVGGHARGQAEGASGALRRELRLGSRTEPAALLGLGHSAASHHRSSISYRIH